MPGNLLGLPILCRANGITTPVATLVVSNSVAVRTDVVDVEGLRQHGVVDVARPRAAHG